MVADEEEVMLVEREAIVKEVEEKEAEKEVIVEKENIIKNK